jgi:tellurite methyltransferase
VQYLFEENKEAFFQKIARITDKHGIDYFNVFVEKPFLELPPDWDIQARQTPEIAFWC